MEEKHIRRLKKLIQTETTNGDKFLQCCKPEFIDFLCHMIHTFKEYSHPELKKHITKVLKSKTARIAKSRMRKANQETGGGFFDFLKNTGSSIANLASNLGSQIASTASSWFDKGKDLATKGFNYAKPYIKEYGPDALAFATSHIPMAGPSIAPIVRKGTQFLFDKFF